MGRALIVSAGASSNEYIAARLTEMGYSRPVIIPSGAEARRRMTESDFELIVVNSPLPDEFGHEVCINAVEKTDAGVVFLVKAAQAEQLLGPLSEQGVLLLSKPFSTAFFVQAMHMADCRALLAALAERVQGRIWGDARWDSQLKEAVEAAEQGLRDQCGDYAKLNDAIAQALPDDGILVRDITVSGSLWGSRLFRAHGPLMNIHSLAGAIGMGLPMAVGTAIANPQRKVVGLVGDGGLSLNLGELATLAQEKANVTLLIMNDGGYGVMRGIQDKYFGGRQYYNELHTPDFSLLAQAMGLQAWSVDRAEDFQAVMTEALAMPGPSVVEVKMGQIGALRFAGPPQKTLY